MNPRKYDAPKEVLPANYPVSMMEKFYVVEPNGMISCFIPVLHAGHEQDSNKVLKGWRDKDTGDAMFSFQEWADDAGYRALDEVFAEEGYPEDFNQYVKSQERTPEPQLPQLVLDRRKFERPTSLPV